jgi:hypothetical protein
MCEFLFLSNVNLLFGFEALTMANKNVYPLLEGAGDSVVDIVTSYG